MDWSDDVYDTVRIDALLSPLGTGDPITLVFDIKLNPKKATYKKNDLTVGYYLLTIQLYGDEQFEWGTAEAVRIVAGATTKHVFGLN